MNLERPSPTDATQGGNGDALFAAVRHLADRTADLVASAEHPQAPVTATPGWTVHDLSAHLVAAIATYADGPRGTARVVDDPADLPRLNQQLLADHVDATTPELAEKIRNSSGSLIAQIAGYGSEPPTFRFNGGEPVGARTALGLLVGEFLVHGHDLADTLTAPWPIAVEHVELAIDGLEQVLPGWVRRREGDGHTATYDIRLRGGNRHVWAFDQGHLDCHADPEAVRIDCHMSGAAEAIILVMYGRLSPWRAALSGQVLAWGRRPWLALSLADRFHEP